MKTFTRSIFALLLLVIVAATWLVAIEPQKEALAKAQAEARQAQMTARLAELQKIKAAKDAEDKRIAEEKTQAAEAQRLFNEKAKADEDQRLAEEQARQKELSDLKEQLRAEQAARAAELQGGGPIIQPNNPFLPAAAPQPSVIGVLEASVGKDNGAISSGVTLVPGKLGQAMQFNGQDSQIDFGASAGNVGTSDFTIDFWVKTANAPPSHIEDFLAKRAVCGFGDSLEIVIGDGHLLPLGILTCGLRDDNTPNGAGACQAHSTTPVNDGLWHQLAWVRQADPGKNTCSLLIYLDGHLDSSIAGQPITIVNNPSHLILGRNVCDAGDGRSPFGGATDALNIWKRALTAAEIAGNYQAAQAGKPAAGNGLVNSWSSQNVAFASVKPATVPPNPLAPPPLADGAVSDSAGKDHAAISGGVTVVPGKVGQAFQFNGQDSQIDLGPSAGNFGTKDFTIEYWMNAPVNSNPAGEAFLSKRADCAPGSQVNIHVGHGAPGAQGILVLGLNDELVPGRVGPSQLISTFRANDGAWHHIVWERRSDAGGTTCTLSLYVDGILKNTAASQPVTCVSTPAHLLMGQNVCIGVDGQTAYSGLADGLNIWNRALTAAEITENYQASLAGKHPAGNGLLNSWSAEKAAVNPGPLPGVPMIIRGPGIRVRPNPRPPPVIQPNQIL